MESYGDLYKGVFAARGCRKEFHGLTNSYQASRVEDAKQIKVIPIANSGAPDICNLIHDKVPFPLARACFEC